MAPVVPGPPASASPPADVAPISSGSAVAPSTPVLLPVDARESFSVVLRSDEVMPTVTALPKELVLHTSSLVLRLSGDKIEQDANDLRGVDPILTRPAADFSNLHGPTFRDSFLELTPGARRYGDTQVYRPLAPKGSFKGFRAINYAHKGAEGYGFRLGPSGSVWGVSITPVQGERFLTHLGGPEVWPQKEPPTPELGDPSWKRTIEAPDGPTFTIGTSGGQDVVSRRKAGDASVQLEPLPALSETIKTVGFTFSAPSADAAFVYVSLPDFGQGQPSTFYAAVYDGKTWQAESAPPTQLLTSFCLRPDGTRWAVGQPAGPALPRSKSRDEENVLLKRLAKGEWQRIVLPDGVSPLGVHCDDPQNMWISASDPKDDRRGSLLMRSRPVENPTEVSIVDWPRDGDVRRDIEPAPIMVSSFAAQPATSVCPLPQLWALLAREGGRVPIDWNEEPAKSAKEKTLRARALAEKKRIGSERLAPLLKGAILPEGAKLELIGKVPNRWIATLVPNYEAGRKLVDTTIVRLPEERPKLLCVVPDQRSPYTP